MDIVIAIMVLWQLVHLGTPIYGYMLLAYANPKSAQGATKIISLINLKHNVGKRNKRSA